MTAGPSGDGFLSRWARRKAEARQGDPHVEPAPATGGTQAIVGRVEPLRALSPAADEGLLTVEPPEELPAKPLPTLADVAALTRDSDYSRFVGAGVDDTVKRAAMKKLFTDPHFNVMDGLDTYIDDYGKPDPIPFAMLREMNQSKFLRLFETEDDEEQDEATTPVKATTETLSEPDDHADLRLQQDDAARHPGPDQGTRA